MSEQIAITKGLKQTGEIANKRNASRKQKSNPWMIVAAQKEPLQQLFGRSEAWKFVPQCNEGISNSMWLTVIILC